MRAKLKLNQQNFAALMGFTVMTVSRWESGSADPSGANEAFLELLANVLKLHSRGVILAALRDTGPEALPMMRTLTWLERHPTLPQAMPTFANSSPPSSARRPPFSPHILPDSTR
jgi:transcriptional regulator with XRE-family HTH domain